MARLTRLSLALATLLMAVGMSAHAQEESRHSFELTATLGAGITNPDASLASIRRADAAAYRGARAIQGLSLGYCLPGTDVILSLDWSNVGMEVHLQDNSLLSRANLNLYGLKVMDRYPILGDRVDLLTYGTIGLAHAINDYTSLTDDKAYGKAWSLGLGLNLGCGLRYRLSRRSAVELKGGTIGTMLFKWRGDEAVIHPEAYSYKGYNRYGLFYTSLAYTVLF